MILVIFRSLFIWVVELYICLDVFLVFDVEIFGNGGFLWWDFFWF